MPPLAPAAPQVAEPTRPPIPAFPTDLPLPEHEMSAPLLEGEMRIPTADTAGASAVSGLESFVAAPPPPKPPTPEPPPPPPLLWKNPERQRLHWAHAGLTAWWSERQLTGRGVRIALLSTGADLGHPDLQGAVGAVFDALRPEAAQAGADVHGLGTQAAVVAAGRGHIAFGAAPEATLLIGKIGDYDHEITPESLLAGLHWALHQQAH
ncbi:MAG TPA: S8 family serine peptidase, partial [Saprospiraceae bacterium]|nr:S8 family serine peptidase [Saprospiraceae bacterium]